VEFRAFFPLNQWVGLGLISVAIPACGDMLGLERDSVTDAQPRFSFCLSMIFSENRNPLFEDHALEF
jgi:hypothetical protein